MAQLNVNGLSPEAVFSTLVNGGISERDATQFVAQWLLTIVGEAQRVFNYGKAFADTDPSCGPTFVRSFVHQDWVDGESIVQASQTTGEAGFNLRFHQIEADLDALKADVAKVFACLASMRQDLSALFDEIRTELNAIDKQVFPQQIGPIPPRTIGGATTVASGQFMGTAKLFNTDVTVWQTPQGVLALPALHTVNPSPANDPRVQLPALVARFVEETAAVRQTFTTAFTKQAFVAKFGTAKLTDGTLVQDALTIIPDDTKYDTVDALVSDLAARQAATLRTTLGATAVITSSFGLNASTGSVAAAPLDSFSAIPAAARAALIKNGIDTLGKLSAAGSAKIMAVMTQEKVTNVTVADAASWGAQALTLTKVQ
jgi:hypothetical protein